MHLTKTGWIPVVICILAGMHCGTDKAVDPGHGESFSVEAESYISSFDIAPSVAIRKVTCSTASGGQAVAGMDMDGEWIQLALSVAEAGIYDVTIRYSALEDSVIILQIVPEDCGGEQEPEFTLDDGQGVG